MLCVAGHQATNVSSGNLVELLLFIGGLIGGALTYTILQADKELAAQKEELTKKKHYPI